MKWINNLLDLNVVDFVTGFYLWLICAIGSILILLPIVK